MTRIPPWRKLLGAFAEAVESGKVRVIGASNLEARRLREAPRGV